MSDLRALVESGLVDKEDGTIFDTTTNLLWQQSPSNKKFTWESANEYCKSLTLAGHNDWRLPTKEELEHLINRKYCSAIDPILKCKPGWYWSSTLYVSSQGGAWCIAFSGDGRVPAGSFPDGGRRKVYFLRAVRG